MFLSSSQCRLKLFILHGLVFFGMLGKLSGSFLEELENIWWPPGEEIQWNDPVISNSRFEWTLTKGLGLKKFSWSKKQGSVNSRSFSLVGDIQKGG